MQDGDQGRRRLLKFEAVRNREVQQQALTPGGQTHKNLSRIAGVDGARHQAERLQAVHQADRAVMLQQQTPRKVANGRRILRAGRPDDQQGLMLLRLDAALVRGRFAEGQKAPELKPEFLDLPVLQRIEVLLRLMHRIYRNTIYTDPHSCAPFLP